MQFVIKFVRYVHLLRKRESQNSLTEFYFAKIKNKVFWGERLNRENTGGLGVWFLRVWQLGGVRF